MDVVSWEDLLSSRQILSIHQAELYVPRRCQTECEQQSTREWLMVLCWRHKSRTSPQSSPQFASTRRFL